MCIWIFSRVPIKRGETTVAIICKKNKNISNIPCYLESTLISIHIPVIGSMADYGVFADATIECCSFINTLASLNGTFCNSRNAG